jgi:hypothetical protein
VKTKSSLCFKLKIEARLIPKSKSSSHGYPCTASVQYAADIAMETSAMTKSNILQQAGVSILAQANQTPQLALQLLQG